MVSEFRSTGRLRRESAQANRAGGGARAGGQRRRGACGGRSARERGATDAAVGGATDGASGRTAGAAGARGRPCPATITPAPPLGSPAQNVRWAVRPLPARGQPPAEPHAAEA